MSARSPTISVVVVAYDSADVIESALASVGRWLPEAEIVVVDNSGDADTAAAVGQAGGRLVSGHGNVGFGAGVNLGARKSSGTHVLVLNPDAAIEDVDLRGISDVLKREPFGIVALAEHDAGETVPLLRVEYPWPVELAWSLIAWFLVPAEFSLSRPRWPRAKSRLSGAAFLVDRQEFVELGGFDERLFLYHEDEELSRRYRLSGRPVDFTTTIVVGHEQGHSGRSHGELVHAWQLLSLVQLVASEHGRRSAEAASRIILTALSLIEWCGRRGGRLPKIGRRAAQKAKSAGELRSCLRDAVAKPPRQDAYPDARRIMAPILDQSQVNPIKVTHD